MGASPNLKIAIVWRGETRDRGKLQLEGSRLSAVGQALGEAGFAPEACIYDEAAAQEFRAQLLGCAAAIVFVNPLQDGRRRYQLDQILREAAAAGVQVSAHPDVIDKMGVKAVLWRTRELGWGSDVAFDTDPDAFARDFPARLPMGPRVLKPNRGNGGQGVWKVEAAGEDQVRVEAAEGDPTPRIMTLPALFAARAGDFADAGGLVDQAWQPGVRDGMVRCYMSGGDCAGFGTQKVKALVPADAGPGGPRLYSGPDDPRYPWLRALMEQEWTPGLCRLLEIDPADLPVIWDADFILPPGPDRRTATLCEINVSAVFPMPDEAPRLMAQTLARRELGQGARDTDTVI